LLSIKLWETTKHDWQLILGYDKKWKLFDAGMEVLGCSVWALAGSDCSWSINALPNWDRL